MATVAVGAHDCALPGIAEQARMRLNIQAREALQLALAEGRPPHTLVLQIESSAAHVEDRRSVVQHLRRCGLLRLARRIERAKPPLGHVVVFIDTDGATEVTSVPLRKLGLHDGTQRSAALQPGQGGV